MLKTITAFRVFFTISCVALLSTGIWAQPVSVSMSSASHVSCFGGNDGSLTVTTTPGVAPYTYSWSNGAATSGTSALTNTISSLSSAVYTVTVIDNNGTTATAAAFISQPTTLTASNTTSNDVTCNGGSDGSISLSGGGGTSPYTYLWSNSATTAAISSLTAGTYTVTITDNNACTVTASRTINEPAATNIAVVIDSNATCNGFSDGGATASPSGGTAPYTYLWSNSATTASITGVAAGTYTVTVTDNNACTAVNNGTITEPTLVSVTAVVDSNVSCNGFSDGGATASGTGGTAPYTYLWSNSATTASITGVVAGTYTVTVTDNSGCTASNSETVSEPATLIASTTVDSTASCNGFSDGGATASGTGGTAPYTYLWSNSATTASITGVVAGTYTVTLTDNNGCTDTEMATITEPALLSAATVVDSNVSCNGFSDGGATAAAIGGTAPYTYLWSNSATTASITGVVAGTYTVTITDSKGCTDADNSTITEPALLSAATVVDSNVSINGFSDGGATASATGGTAPYTYLWSNSATTASITGVTAGTFTVTITDSNGCTDTDNSTITEPAAMSVSVVIDSNVSCNGLSDGGATASATGGTAPYTYLWSNSATTASITGVVAGTYTVTLTDNNGGTTVNSGTVNEPATMIAATVVDSNASCNGLSDGGATASTTGGTAPYTYLWSNSATTASITGVVAGTYTVTITDSKGCTDTDNSTITEPATMIAATVVDSNASCNGLSDGGATASATGGTAPYTYLWSNSATTASITGVVAGTYTVTITDSNGCTDTDNSTITEPTALIASTVVDSNVSVNGLSDGGATATASGGTAPYTYLWSNSATTASITGVVAGTYTVTLTDSKGCTDTDAATITEPTSLSVSVVIDSNVSCNGLSDGGATASASGGVSPYTYLWSNSATTASITGVAAGTYTVTLTDNNGATAVNSGTVNEPATMIAATVVDSNVSCNGLSDGGATASATGGTAPYTYTWSNSATTASITGVMAGTYTVTITDSNGCTDTDNSTITEPTALIASTVVDSNVSVNGLSDGGATASASGGTAPYTYTWSNSATTASITGVVAGTYTVTLTDSNGCTDTDAATITEPTSLSVSVVIDSNVSCNGLSDGGATASASGGVSPYTYLWSNSATTASITGVVAGTYTVTLTDNNGATAVNSGTVNEPATMIAATVVDSNASCNGLSDGGATASATGGTAPYTYLWSNSATTASITGVMAGSYTVTITDSNGCTDTDNSTITEPTVLSVATVVDSNVSVFGQSDGGATASGTGGTSPYTYTWSNSATTASITGIAAGTYTVTLTDNNGCTDTDTVAISQPPAITATVSVDSNVTCNGLADGGLSVSVTGGDQPYTYLWSNAADTTFITGLTAGTYTVTVTDLNGVTAVGSASITEPSAIVVSMTADSNASCFGLADGRATSIATGGVAPYTYSWSNSATSASITGIAAGSYTVTVTDASGCTGSNSVNITEPAEIITVTDTAVCYSFTWVETGMTYTTSGPRFRVLTAANGCDSTLRLNLVINGTTTATVRDTACYTYTWAENGMTYTQSGTYRDTLVGANANGCDSIITLRLVIREADVSVIRSGFDLIALANGGDPRYQWIDCGNGDTAITGATGFTYTAIQNGFYGVVVMQYGCVDTSQCVNVVNIGIGENSLDEALKVYPNPASGKITIELSAQQYMKERVQLFDLAGSLLRDFQLKSQKEIVDISDLAEGVYMLRIGTTYRKLIVTD